MTSDDIFMLGSVIGTWFMVVVFPTVAMLYSPTEWRKECIKKYKYGSKEYYKCFIWKSELDDFIGFYFGGFILIDIMFIALIFTGNPALVLLGAVIGPDGLFFHLLSRYRAMKKVDEAREKLADIEREERLVKEIIEGVKRS